MPTDKFIHDLLSTLSHDIQGSIGGANTLSQMIGSDERIKDDEKLTRRLNLMQSEYLTTGVKLKALALYAHLFDHKEQRCECALNKIAQASMNTLVDKDANLKNQAFAEALELQSLPTIDGYEAFLGQYFIELYSNTLLHAKVPTGMLKATLFARASENQTSWQVIYQDNGHTLSQKDIAYFCKPFKTLQKEKGTHLSAGLGIARLMRIVELHGGTLELYAGVNQDYPGLRVEATFPI